MSILGNNLLAQYYAQNQGLPFGYEAVEYLESTGTQWIDSVFILTNNSKVEISIYNPTDFSSSPDGGILFGSRNTIEKLSFGYVASMLSASPLYAHKQRFDYYKDNLVYNPILSQGKHVIIKDKQYNYIDSELISVNTVGNFTTELSCYILDYNTNGQPSNIPFVGRLYYITMYESDVVSRRFIPCVRKSDGKPGLYDLCRSICPLTGTPFYINAGTGEFVTP